MTEVHVIHPKEPIRIDDALSLAAKELTETLEQRLVIVDRQAISALVEVNRNTIKGRIARQYGVNPVGSSRVDLQACKLEYSIVSPK